MNTLCADSIIGATIPSIPVGLNAIHWFRKDLRLHDNPALCDCIARRPSRLYPVYMLERGLDKRDIGINRYTHMLETLEDLDASLRHLGSRLFVIQGDSSEQMMRQAVTQWDIGLLTYELDTEPTSVQLDEKINNLAASMNVIVSTKGGHTLFEPSEYVKTSKRLGKGFLSYGSFTKLFLSMGPVRTSVPAPTSGNVPPFTTTEKVVLGIDPTSKDHYSVPTVTQMGYPRRKGPLKFPGGETEALRRLRETVCDRRSWVAKFEKPNTSPNSLEPSTTVLSPYLRHGSLSVALMYEELNRAITGFPNPSQPPVSLHGQLLWREFFHLNGATTPSFDRMEGNPVVRQIPWERDEAKILAWKEGRTGYPFIDAIMRQLNEEGWIHHLGRHAVACFLTRGDLWQHWEEGARVFELLLLDHDWALNSANWQWLSCSNFFYQYFRCYSPIAFGKKTDPEGEYIKKWVPEVRHFPKKYIYEPFNAPKSVQIMCQCVVGVDYPYPLVSHEEASKTNMERMKEAYNLHSIKIGGVAENAEKDEEEAAKDAVSSKKKQKK